MIKDAVAGYERAIVIARETGNDYDLASHLQNLGATLLSEGVDLPRAERTLHEALKAAERSQSVDAAMGCLSTLGSLHRGVGNLHEAARLYGKALEVSRLAGNRLSEGNNLSNLGLAIKDLGDEAKGEAMIREALAIAVTIGDRRGEGNRTGHIGGILFAKANRMIPGAERLATLEGARDQTLNALSIAQETGDAEKAVCWLMNLGNIEILKGEGTEGLRHYEEALGVSQARGFALLEAQVRFNLGLALANRRQLRPARDHLRASLSLLKKMGSPLVNQVEFHIDRLDKLIQT